MIFPGCPATSGIAATTPLLLRSASVSQSTSQPVVGIVTGEYAFTTSSEASAEDLSVFGLALKVACLTPGWMFSSSMSYKEGT
eukprot:698510-Prymnesium_polylepis.1